MGLREVHGAGPGARHHLGHVGPLHVFRGVLQQGGDRTLREARIHGERQIGRGLKLLQYDVEGRRQTLSSERFRHGKTHPSARNIGIVCCLVALRRSDRSIVVADATLLVADEVERRENLLAEFPTLTQDRLDGLKRGIRKAREIVMPLDWENVLQKEHDVFNRGFVDRHPYLPRRTIGGPARPPDSSYVNHTTASGKRVAQHPFDAGGSQRPPADAKLTKRWWTARASTPDCLLREPGGPRRRNAQSRTLLMSIRRRQRKRRASDPAAKAGDGTR